MEASRTKGLDLIGIIDAQAPAVMDEIESLIQTGQASELEEGGISFEQTVLLLGSEVEIYDASCSGPLHVLCYFPTIEKMRAYREWLSAKMKNTGLSTQRFYGTGRELQEYVHKNGGLFIPAHIFTPFKSLYGKGVKQSLKEVFHPEWIDAVELGLSADTSMANQIKELEPYPYVTNSDAHSLGNLGREYQKLSLRHPSFQELKWALNEQNDRRVVSHYGLDPRMGKYHQTVCGNCHEELDPDAKTCFRCGSKKVIKGVADRIVELKSEVPQTRHRPLYVHQVLLSSIPGIGPKTYNRLIDTFESEMNVIHHADSEEVRKVMPNHSWEILMKMRKGQLSVKPGGGGTYGTIMG
ncbi:endonuclease Q family protein [Halobacillus litoralis]|uniref:endonuclease Q family protein n=1 Tax=Halobacillus litoralis TaxID=45668 RepID=UPI0021E5B174|nr:endonuclease Q family protein [Halobacillus litoralis]